MNYLILLKQAIVENSERTAFVDQNGSRRISYDQLDKLSSKIAGKLHTMGAKTGRYVIVNMARSANYLAAYLGVLKAGCAVIPLIPQYPEDRIAFIAKDSEAFLTIREDFFDDIDTYAPFEAVVDDDSPALMIYTSGSTGRPKGIVHSAAGVAAAVMRQRILFDGIDHPVCAASASFSFIAHVLELLVPLSLGAAVHILSDEIRCDPSKLAAYYSEHKIDCSIITVQLLKLMTNESFTLKRIFTGSEPVSGIFLKDTEIINIYGQSETVLAATIFKIDRRYDNTPIGRPFGDLKAVVLGENGLPVSQGETGEVCIEGKFGVKYYKNPELSAKTFIPTENGNTLIHTGDMAFFDENGDLVYVSRKDWMVKINGQRVEPLEVERALSQISGVSHAVVRAFEDSMGEKYLAAYYDGEEKEESGLRAELAKTLPEYMIPRMLIHMEVLPLNINGKLARTALPEPTDLTQEITEAENEMQQKISELCLQVLNRGSIGPDTDLFAAGISSIGVIRLCMLLDENFHVPVKIADFKTNNTVRKLEQLLLKSKQAEKYEILVDYPLTQTQQGIFVECMSNPDTTIYNIPKLIRLGKGMDAHRLVNALKEAVNAHPYIKTRLFTDENGNIRAKRMDGEEAVIEFVEGEVPAKEKLIYPFDLLSDRLYRIAVYQTENGVYLFMDLHHIIFDGESCNILTSDIDRAYAGETPETEAYSGFEAALDEEKARLSDSYTEAKEYYGNLLSDCDADNLPPYDPERDCEKDFDTITEKPGLPREKVLEFCKANGISENAFFSGVFGYVLSNYIYRNDVTYAAIYNGRSDSRTAHSVSMFVKTLPVVCRIKKEQSVSGYLKEIGKQLLDSMTHDLYSFAEISGAYGVHSDVLFAFQGDRFVRDTLCGEQFEEVEITPDTAKVAINMIITADAGRYTLNLEYQTKLYNRSLMTTLSDAVFCVAEEFLLKEAVGSAALIPPAKASEILRMSEGEKLVYDDSRTWLECFREQVKAVPDSVAVEDADSSLTYAEMDIATAKIASWLRKKGIGKGRFVAICMGRVKEFIVSAVGIQRAGAGYLPLNPSDPEDRRNFITEDANVDIVLTQELVFKILSEEPDPDRNEEAVITPDDFAYMIYTSGSTGKPKGVVIPQRGLTHFVLFLRKYLHLRQDSKVMCYSAFVFDNSVGNLFPILTLGGTLVIPPEDVRHDMNLLKAFMQEHGVTGGSFPTQIGQLVCEEEDLKLDYVTMGGEKMTRMPKIDCTVINLYGPTECTVDSLLYTLNKNSNSKDIPIGRPVDDCGAYVMGKNENLLPVGAVGELCLSGPQMAVGYWNRPEKTAESFRNATLPDGRKVRLYHTGDLVRYNEDHLVEYVGRADFQVKLRGFRIELPEIENRSTAINGIRQSVALVRNEQIVLYYTADREIGTEELKNELGKTLPPYMIPAYYIQMPEMPLTVRGKIDRRALPDPKVQAVEMTPPQNDTQRKIMELCAEVIRHSDFGIDTNLYEVGLSSLGTIRLSVLLDKQFNVPIKIADLSQNATIRAIERLLCESEESETYETLEDYPLTQTQQGIFVECVANPEATIYNIPMLMHMGKGVDADRLAEALRNVIDAHPYVKTRLFTDENGSIRARRMDRETPVVEFICGTAPSKEELVRPFDLLNDRLYRTAVYKTADEVLLFMDFHHIICDGDSYGILMADIDRAYAGETVETESYTGYEAATDEEKVRRTDAYVKAKSYYEELFEDCDGENLPSLDPEHGDETHKNFITSLTVPRKKVLEFCKATGVSENAFFSGVFGYALAKFNRRDAIAYASIYNGRNDSRTARSVSMFVKTMPVVCRIPKELMVSDYLKRIGTQLINSMANDIYSFAEISKTFELRAEVLFSFQGNLYEVNSLCGEPVRRENMALDTAKAAIDFSVFADEKNYFVELDYKPEFFSRNLMDALVDAVSNVTEEFMTKQTLGEVSLMTPCQAAEMLKVAEGEKNVFDTDKTWLELFRDQAAKTPDRIAVEDASGALTYKELDQASDRVAAWLHLRDEPQNSFVAVSMDRTKEFIVSVIGIWKAGSAYLPIDPNAPVERYKYMLADSEANILLTDGNIMDILSSDAPCVPTSPITPESRAYMIYTSGSTGTPKGVVISHRALLNFVHFINRRWHLTRDSRILCHSAFVFDASVEDLYPVLTVGGTLVIAPEAVRRDMRLLINFIRSHGVTGGSYTTLLGQVVAAEKNLQLDYLCLGGEKMTQIPKINCPVYNAYGPTEFTVDATYFELEQGKQYDNIPIGRALDNCAAYVLGNNDDLLPRGAAGELCLAGPQMSEGYWKLPEKTASVFRMLALPDGREIKVYHTGDLVRYNFDDQLEYLGRIDFQVKLRGFRIELPEIESRTLSYSGIDHAVALIKNGQICLYYTANHEVDIEDLKSELRKTLPDYMIPLYYIQMEAMPLTVNDKVDRKALPEPEIRARKIVRPENETEQHFCEVFAKVLNLKEVSVTDSFFDIGGSSLSAINVVMMSERAGYELVYNDIFDNPTPRALSDFVKGTKTVESKTDKITAYDYSAIDNILQYNTMEHIDEFTAAPLGNIILTGPVGFLGIHILKEFLTSQQGKAYCLLRKGRSTDCESRLRNMLFYYFNDSFDDVLDRIVCIEGDITVPESLEALKSIDAETVINCAACVKHFTHDDTLERANVKGIENLIGMCHASGKRLIQISTSSIAEAVIDDRTDLSFAENHLYKGQIIENEYASTKFRAERAVLQARADKGFDGIVIRVGNLMSRYSDGEFQINFLTNNFMRTLRAFALINEYPITDMSMPIEFSPIDCTAAAILKLASCRGKFSVFHAYNPHDANMADVIFNMREYGFPIDFVSQDVFKKTVDDLSADENNSSIALPLSAYNTHTKHLTPLIPNNLFTTEVLYRLGYHWPIVGENYFKAAIKALDNLGFFTQK